MKPSYLLGMICAGTILTGWLLHQPASRTIDRIAQPKRTVSSLPASNRQLLSTEDQKAVFENFTKWIQDFKGATGDERLIQADTGMKLALQRRALMENLMKNDPRQALEKAVTLDVWTSLPSEIQQEVEEPFSALADFKVYPVCAPSSPDPARALGSNRFPNATRLTAIEGQPELDSYVFGRRIGLPTKENSPVQGIRLGQTAALRENIFHELSAAEIEAASALYPLANPRADRDFSNGDALSDSPVTALAGGKIFIFGDRASFEDFESAIARLDGRPDPYGGAAVLFLPYAPGSTGGFDLKGATARSNLSATDWTETKKKVFMIRCDFSDKPNSDGAVPEQSFYESLLNTSVSNSVRDFSYGKTWIEANVSTSVLRLPQTAAFYSAKDGQGTSRINELLTDAKSAYQAANPSFIPTEYHIIGIWFADIAMSASNFKFSGLATLGGPDLWIQGTQPPSENIRVHVHELGHNYGLGHSSFWLPGGSLNPVGPDGDSDEYGDRFDVMGAGTVPEGSFHAEAKQRLNWLSTGQWADSPAGTSGTYRINRIDHSNTSGVRGLRVAKGDGDHYWLSYRRLYPNSWLKAGANMVWQQSGQGRSWLIDTTPGSVAGDSDRDDSALTIGRTYSDGNLHITTVARGGTSPNEYLDIKVNSGSFPGNVAPTVVLTGPSTISARQTCFLTAQASDANGDELSYSWDFGQGFSFDNHPNATFAWNSGGTYTVKVTVSDLKGKTSQATKVITVTDPLTTWTARANTATGNFNALVASPNMVIAVGEDYTSFIGPIARSTDGTTWTSGQISTSANPNRHVFGGVWDGSQFVLAGEIYSFALSRWQGLILTSTDAVTWARRFTAGSSLRGIAYGNGIYVAVGDDGSIWRSTSSSSWSTSGAVSAGWTQIPSGTTNRLSSIAFGGGKFVAVGHLNTLAVATGTPIVLTSSDGINWTNTTAGAGVLSWQDLRSTTWANDRFLASGWFGKLRHSTDLGTSFSSTRSLTEEISAFAYGNGVWFAAGRERNILDLAIDIDVDLVSSDGSNWTPLVTPSLNDRNAAIFFNNTFITAGKNNSIRQSGTISPGANGYVAWRDSNFPDREALSAPQADRDGDGISNLIEYAFGSSPISGSGGGGLSALPQALIAAPEALLSNRLALQMSIPEPAASDLVHVVEAASSLTGTWAPLATKVGTGAWTWNPGGTSRIVQGTPANGRVTVKIGDSQAINTNTRRFLRLKTYPNQ